MGVGGARRGLTAVFGIIGLLRLAFSCGSFLYSVFVPVGALLSFQCPSGQKSSSCHCCCCLTLSAFSFSPSSLVCLISVSIQDVGDFCFILSIVFSSCSSLLNCFITGGIWFLSGYCVIIIIYSYFIYSYSFLSY